MRTLTLALTVGLALTLGGGKPAAGLDVMNLFSCTSQAASCCDSDCCDLAGCDACGACGGTGADCGCLGRMKLLGCIKPSERCFDDFISPMINFVFFEDPRTLTELRPIFVNHNIPGALGGGSVQLYALQFRAALTDRLSLIAVKDGFIVEKVKDSALDTLLDDGWADISAGLKYNLIRDTCSGTLASVGFTYEFPSGSRRALQDIADGEFHLFVTGGQRLAGGNAHVLSAFGWRKPLDGTLQSESIHWSNHLDVRLTDRIYLLTEVAWWHWLDSADTGLALGVAGHDLFNLSTINVAGNDLVTQNVGLKFKPNRNIEAGIAYEFPLTEFKDIIDDRIQAELILRY